MEYKDVDWSDRGVNGTDVNTVSMLLPDVAGC